MKKSPKNKSPAKTLLRITLLALAALVIGLNVYGINASRLAGDSLPMPLGFGAAVVMSGSMEPELSVGDLLFVVRRESYGVRDVVVYQDGRTAVTHRIVSVSEDEVITRGDANNINDDPITPEQIKGEVVLALPLAGYAVNAVRSPIGTVCILALAVILLECSFRSEKQKDAQELDAIRAEIEELRRQNKR